MRTSFFGEVNGCDVDDASCSTAAASYYCGIFDSLSALFACIMLPLYVIVSSFRVCLLGTVTCRTNMGGSHFYY